MVRRAWSVKAFIRRAAKVKSRRSESQAGGSETNDHTGFFLLKDSESFFLADRLVCLMLKQFDRERTVLLIPGPSYSTCKALAPPDWK
jgi:hypothetical protein